MNSATRGIFWGGFWCGVLDITSACVAWAFFGATPIVIFQSVAGGLFGRMAALQGGWRTAAIGLACHFLIAFTAAAVFWVLSQRMNLLTEHPIISGLLYGEGVFFFMNMVVLPLSALHTPWLRWATLSPWPYLVTGLVGHPFFVGLPISLAVWKYGAAHRRRKSAATYS